MTRLSIATARTLSAALTFATLGALTACEAEGSQRPGSSKSGSEKKTSGKSNAKWTSAASTPGEEVDIELEMTDDGHGVVIAPTEGGDGSQPRVVRRRMVVNADANCASATDEPIAVIGRPIIIDESGEAIEIVEGMPAMQGMPAGTWMGAVPANAPSMPAVAGYAIAPAMTAAQAAPAPTPPPVMLGVRMREVDPILATHLGLTARHASVLEDVAEELNGHAGGLRDHDVIVAVNGEAKAGPADIRRVLRSKKAGDTVVFSVVRPSGKCDVTVTLEAFDHAKFLSATPARVGG